MNKKSIFGLIIFLAFVTGIGIYLYSSNNSSKKINSQNSTYNASKISSNYNQNETNSTNNITNTAKKAESKTSQNQTTETPKKKNQTKKSEHKTVEKEIAKYTSKIRTKDSDRTNNISIACSTLNNTIVENGETFSFCKTLGKATKSKGYEKASVFKNGEEIEALGGGKCQVSSTLYNAVLKTKNLKVVERHPHSGDVYYVPQGKDAAVSYGSYDFKFKNNTGNQIKIKASSTKTSVTIKLLKLE